MFKNLDEIRMTLGFDIDLSGFLGIDDTVRKGAQQITVDIELDSTDTDTPSDELEQLIKSLEETSQIRDTLANPVQISTRLK